MVTVQGKGVSEGIANGPLHFLRRHDPAVPKYAVETSSAESERFLEAQARSAEQLYALAEQCRGASEEATLLFETHAMLAGDEDFTHTVLEWIGEGLNAEYAADRAGEQFAAMLSGADDPYMQERAADIRDITRRIIDNLMGMDPDACVLTVPCILCAEDLTPSETAQLDRAMLLGFVMRQGSENSHTAILARTLGIPAICAAGDALSEKYAGMEAYMDGESGVVAIEPDIVTCAAFREKAERLIERKKLLEEVRGKEDITQDGHRIEVFCNIGGQEDITAVKENDARGVGLFRTEFLYLRSHRPPSEEEQFEVYRKITASMNGRCVIFRTLDIGADKQVQYLKLPKEENPALGVRGVRLCLNRPEIFRTQLRALYRASAFGRISIMFPMITSVWEVRECKRACQSVMAELRRENILFDEDTELGIMLETPASVWIADALAQEVDFFSIGTNDLTQYTLACDRQSDALGKFFDPHHPAVLRAVKHAVDAAHGTGIWVGICGDLAADPELLPFFLGIHIDELSVPPSAVLPMRAAIRGRDTETDISAFLKA